MKKIKEKIAHRPYVGSSNDNSEISLISSSILKN